MISSQWLHFIAFLFIFHIRMIDRIASDLGVCRYAEEPLSQYQCRVIYSAMACWMKAIALDRPIGYHEDVPLGISRRHINERSHTIVLLFSDSRQRAAVLARDLTKAADEDAMKKALTVAAKQLQEWAEENDEQPNLSLLYVFFLRVACQNKLRFFYHSTVSMESICITVFFIVLLPVENSRA